MWVLAWETEGFAAHSNADCLGIAAEKFTIDRIEILLHIVLIWMMVALHVVEYGGLDAETLCTLDYVVDVRGASGSDIEVLDHDVDGVVASMCDCQQFVVAVVVNAAS